MKVLLLIGLFLFSFLANAKCFISVNVPQFKPYEFVKTKNKIYPDEIWSGNYFTGQTIESIVDIEEFVVIRPKKEEWATDPKDTRKTFDITILGYSRGEIVDFITFEQFKKKMNKCINTFGRKK